MLSAIHSTLWLMAFLAALSGATNQLEAGPAHAVRCGDYRSISSANGATAEMVFIPGGTFRMGSENHHSEERYSRTVRVDAFWIDRHEITNAQFREFVDATGYRTLAERGLDPKSHSDEALVVPGSVVFIQPTDLRRGGNITQWWQYVAGAHWRQPTGPGSTIADKDNHPVVHVAYEDALAYARWHGRELPTEAQWEFAARGGHDAEDDWSSAFDADGNPIANTWQGIFPVVNTNDDGFAGTAPVGCYRPNGYGLYDMIGNVWEWTADWYQAGHPREPAVNPRGPNLSVSERPGYRFASRVIKGGSFLCASNFCARYRPSARQPQEINLSASHLGFRTVLNKSSPSTPSGREQKGGL